MFTWCLMHSSAIYNKLIGNNESTSRLTSPLCLPLSGESTEGGKQQRQKYGSDYSADRVAHRHRAELILRLKISLPVHPPRPLMPNLDFGKSQVVKQQCLRILIRTYNVSYLTNSYSDIRFPIEIFNERSTNVARTQHEGILANNVCRSHLMPWP
jgi:hypothetical protein